MVFDTGIDKMKIEKKYIRDSFVYRLMGNELLKLFPIPRLNIDPTCRILSHYPEDILYVLNRINMNMG